MVFGGTISAPAHHHLKLTKKTLQDNLVGDYTIRSSEDKREGA